MKKCVALISFLMFLPVMVQAQKEYPIEQVDVYKRQVDNFLLNTFHLIPHYYGILSVFV